MFKHCITLTHLPNKIVSVPICPQRLYHPLPERLAQGTQVQEGIEESTGIAETGIMV